MLAGHCQPTPESVPKSASEGRSRRWNLISVRKRDHHERIRLKPPVRIGSNATTPRNRVCLKDRSKNGVPAECALRLVSQADPTVPSRLNLMAFARYKLTFYHWIRRMSPVSRVLQSMGKMPFKTSRQSFEKDTHTESSREFCKTFLSFPSHSIQPWDSHWSTSLQSLCYYWASSLLVLNLVVSISPLALRYSSSDAVDPLVMDSVPGQRAITWSPRE